MLLFPFSNSVEGGAKDKRVKMRIVLFVNDSNFSFLLVKPLVEKFHASIICSVFSNRIDNSIKRILNVFRDTHYRYFVYRSYILLMTKINNFLHRNSVKSLCYKYSVNSKNISDIKLLKNSRHLFPADIGIAINFDQIIPEEILNNFRIGVFNVHASRLPYDKGISPVLWAFARGEEKIWSTIYTMESKIDTGDIYDQFTIPVEEKDTAFSLYNRVCTISGKQLEYVIEKVAFSNLGIIGRSETSEGNYLGWPNHEHLKMMRINKKKFISIRQVIDEFIQLKLRYFS